ncbi:uncharacterized protein LOC111877754 isoform X2 [Lactuca sativa]|uniref:uncharacterized protein LOC111877754 isoform X2 n=1 Tax=Lactuca sativa TaxID=4236 RepID=UPI000CD9F717|nr:uncharacterized protein LOC111877754 isoform X2 [Lactuca sativa]
MNSRNKGKRRSYSSSPTRNHRSPTTSSGPAPTTSSSSSGSPPSASVIDAQFVTGDDDLTYLHDLTISPQDKFSNPRSFPYSVKQQCWEKAEKVKGRDPDRWRRDPLGNTIFRKLVGCPGCLCHDYDHILPYSKGGKSTLENCQVLQLIDPKGTVPRCLERILFKKALTVGFQGVIWIFLNYQPMGMFEEDKIREDVSCND